MDTLKIFNVKWSSHSAGPSIFNNRRTEIFLAGCKKAALGHPCKGCFNQKLWQTESAWNSVSPQQAFEKIKKCAPNMFITFVGGEPLDQLKPLTNLCVLLRKAGYNIMVITHYTFDEIMEMGEEGLKLLKNIDILVDGEYKEEYRIWDESKAGDGLHDVIGSGNQIIWDLKQWRHNNFSGLKPRHCAAGLLEKLRMNPETLDIEFIEKRGRSLE